MYLVIGFSGVDPIIWNVPTGAHLRAAFNPSPLPEPLPQPGHSDLLVDAATLASLEAAIPGVADAGVREALRSGLEVSVNALQKRAGEFVTIKLGAPDPCTGIIQRLNQEIQALGGIPVGSVAAWKAQLESCLQRGRITEAQYTAAINEIDHPRSLPKSA